ncbi:MAG: sensor histidine kinase, partial [Bacteroidota bacterium]
QVWVGMAKETAHQLGTPLSSLMAWVEYLKAKDGTDGTVEEIEKDIKRLNTISERFSKIGSSPVLKKENVGQVIAKSIEYFAPRTSSKVSFQLNQPSSHEVTAPLNVPLFEWVLENLFKNAVDAMEGDGSLTITITDQSQFVYIDVRDTGKGIPRSKYQTVFKPGYTSKSRGWGLGLSLSKRIVEEYHGGKIFVKHSEANKGTTFRIVLAK